MTAHPLVRPHLRSLVIAGLVLVAASCDDGGAAPVVTTPPVPANAAGSDTTEASPASDLIPTIGSGAAATLCDDGSPPALGAFDLATGAVRWSYCSAEQALRSVLGATDEVVYLNSVTREQTFELTALDANTGAELWRRPLQPPTEIGMGDPQGPIAGGGVVVLKVSDGDGVAIVGVDAGTGSQRWRTATSGPVADGAAPGAADPTSGTVVLAGPGGSPAPILTPIANTEEMVVVASFAGLRGLDRTTGEERWTSPVVFRDDSQVSVARGAAAVTGGTVIVPAGGNLVAIDARTGAQLWQGQGLHHPSAAEGFVVGYSTDGPSQKVSGLNAATGATLWTAPGSPSYGDLWAIGGGAVSVIDATGIVAYELATGAVRWRRDDVMGQPQSAVGDAVIVGWEAYVGVLSPTDGSTRWESIEPLGSPLMSSVGSNSGSLFVSVNSLPFGD